MMILNRNILYNSDNYELCIRKIYEGEKFFVLLCLMNMMYEFKLSCVNFLVWYFEE